MHLLENNTPAFELLKHLINEKNDVLDETQIISHIKAPNDFFTELTRESFTAFKGLFYLDANTFIYFGIPVIRSKVSTVTVISKERSKVFVDP